MRLPVGALIAALVIVAAGSVVLTTHFRHAAYVIDARGLAPGQNVTLSLDFIPREVLVLGENATHMYDVYVRADAVFRAPDGTLREGAVVYRGVPANGTVTIDAVSARAAACRIAAVRTA